MPTLAFAHPDRALPGPVPGSRGSRTGWDARRPSGHGVNRSYAPVYALAAYARGYTRMDPAKAASEVVRLRGLKQYQEGHRLTLDHVALLGKIASRGKSNELPMPKKARPVAPSGAKAELDKLRIDPSYFDRYAPNHKVVVARVNELMGQLHPEG